MDLLETNKNSATKSVLALRVIARDALDFGVCACDRCRKSGGDQSGYEALHSAVVDGKPYRRLFTKATANDAYMALAGAWLEKYQEPLPKDDVVDLEKIQSLGTDEMADRLLALFLVMGILREKEPGRFVFVLGPYK